MADGAIDIAHLRRWIGREETIDDYLPASLVARFNATIGVRSHDQGDGAPAPRLIHFCLCQPAAPMPELGADGHAARGGFLPPVPLPRRMWAGSTVTFHDDLTIGAGVRRVSRIVDVALKEGRSGTLVFVTVDHHIESEGRLAVSDRQTIVYREAATSEAPSVGGDPAPTGAATIDVMPDAALLFRYSALTFNAHRIHYDRRYATEVERYPGLVVHGPLQATLLLHLAARQHGRAPDRFAFSSASPLYDDATMRLHAAATDGGRMGLWSARVDGPVAMRATAEWTG